MSRLQEKTTGILTRSEYRSVRYQVVYGLILFFLLLAVAAALLPVLWLFFSGFKAPNELYAGFRFFPREFRISKLFDVWAKLSFGRYFVNSLISVAGAVVFSVLFNGILAYVIAVVRPKGYRIVYGLVLGSYMIPAMTAMVPLYKSLLNLGLIGNAAGLGFVPLWLIFGANAFYLIMMKNYFDSIPKALFEAASLSGCSALKMFFYIVLPLSKPIVGVIAIFTMTASWSDFLLPYLVTRGTEYETVMVAIYRLQANIGDGFTEDELLMALTISILPLIVLFVVFQKQITGSVASAGIKE